MLFHGTLYPVSAAYVALSCAQVHHSCLSFPVSKCSALTVTTVKNKVYLAEYQ